MARNAVRKKNRAARRERAARKYGCAAERCGRKGQYKVELSDKRTVLFCRKHYNAALAKGLFSITDQTRFD